METKKNTLIQDIGSTFDELLGQLSSFDQGLLNRVPYEGSWTAGQVAEHIIICSSGIPDSKTAPADRPYNEKVDAIEDLFLNFDLQFKTDPSIAPGPPQHEGEALIQKIKDIRFHLESIVRNTDLKVLCMDMELPTFGYLTRYEWLRFIIVHVQRHTHQIKKICDIVRN